MTMIFRISQSTKTGLIIRLRARSIHIIHILNNTLLQYTPIQPYHPVTQTGEEERRHVNLPPHIPPLVIGGLA